MVVPEAGCAETVGNEKEMKCKRTTMYSLKGPDLPMKTTVMLNWNEDEEERVVG